MSCMYDKAPKHRLDMLVVVLLLLLLFLVAWLKVRQRGRDVLETVADLVGDDVESLDLLLLYGVVCSLEHGVDVVELCVHVGQALLVRHDDVLELPVVQVQRVETLVRLLQQRAHRLQQCLVSREVV